MNDHAILLDQAHCHSSSYQKAEVITGFMFQVGHPNKLIYLKFEALPSHQT